MKLEYIEDSLDNIIANYPKAIEQLTLSRYSSMSCYIRCNKLSLVRVILVKNDQGLVGWGWSQFDKDRRMIVWIYIREKYRRKNIGTIILGKKMIRARRLHRPLRVDPWDLASRSFFSKNKAKGIYE